MVAGPLRNVVKAARGSGRHGDDRFRKAPPPLKILA